MPLTSEGHTLRAARSFHGAELVPGALVTAGEDSMRRDGEVGLAVCKPGRTRVSSSAQP